MYKNLNELWTLVTSGSRAFDPFGSNHDHERRFLQALHSKESLQYFAKSLAATSRGLPVTVASAFIDKNPRFFWSDRVSGNGEIADILVIVTQSRINREAACLVQAKVTSSEDAYGTDPSSKQQVGLYEHWPTVTFASKDDVDFLERAGQQVVHSLNGQKRAYPFSFLRVCKISPTADSKSTSPAPKWKHQAQRAVPEPIAITPMPTGDGATLFMDWLSTSRNSAATGFESISLGTGNSDFSKLVDSLLSLLSYRQSQGLLGHSRGEVYREVATFAANGAARRAAFSLRFEHVETKIPDGFDESYDAIATCFANPSTRPGTGTDSRLRQFGRALRRLLLERGRQPRPFLVLRIIYGPEAKTEVKPPPGDHYPGGGIL